TKFISFLGYQNVVEPKGSVQTSTRNSDVVGTPTLREYGHEDFSDEDYHIVAFVNDGQYKTDIYLDGCKQHYASFGYSTIDHFRRRGKIDIGGEINSIRIGSRDSSGTDSFSAFWLKRIILKSTVYD